MIRCKFKVNAVKQFEYGLEIESNPVYSNDPNHENKKFWDASPSGNFSILVNKSASGYDAMKELHPGREFYIDLTPVPVDGEQSNG